MTQKKKKTRFIIFISAVVVIVTIILISMSIRAKNMEEAENLYLEECYLLMDEFDSGKANLKSIYDVIEICLKEATAYSSEFSSSFDALSYAQEYMSYEIGYAKENKNDIEKLYNIVFHVPNTNNSSELWKISYAIIDLYDAYNEYHDFVINPEVSRAWYYFEEEIYKKVTEDHKAKYGILLEKSLDVLGALQSYYDKQLSKSR